ncbi:MAG: hypothetical protein AAF191_04155 [Verrucomicrobiota bacterium]
MPESTDEAPPPVLLVVKLGRSASWEMIPFASLCDAEGFAEDHDPDLVYELGWLWVDG